MGLENAVVCRARKRRGASRALLGIVWILATASGTVGAETVAGGLRLDLPDEWVSGEEPGSASALNDLGQGAGTIAGVWVRTERDGVTANLNLTVSPRTVHVSETGLITTRAAVRRDLALRGKAEKGRWIEGVSLVHLNGAPAYRLEVSSESDGERLRQLQYLVSGRQTYVLTFSATGESYDQQEAAFERIARSVRFESHAGFFRDISPEACGALLGVFLGLSLGARRLRSRQRRQ